VSWDDLIDEAVAEGRPPSKCGVAVMFNGLPPDAVKSINEALARPELTTSALAAVINRRVPPDNPGVKVQSLRRHRRGECNCTTS
jgi:hypothetical protein